MSFEILSHMSFGLPRPLQSAFWGANKFTNPRQTISPMRLHYPYMPLVDKKTKRIILFVVFKLLQSFQNNKI